MPQQGVRNTVLEQLLVYVKEAMGCSAADFARKFPEPALVVEPFLDADEDAATSFSTVSARGGEGLPGVPLVARLKKRPGANAFASMVTLGRARNNDICLPAADVSKFHAYFVVAPEGTDLVAASASNGTFLQERILDANQRVTLEDGAKLRFASVRATYRSPLSLYEYLRSST
jgi:hypothetical protein